MIAGQFTDGLPLLTAHVDIPQLGISGGADFLVATGSEHSSLIAKDSLPLVVPYDRYQRRLLHLHRRQTDAHAP